MRIDGEQNYTRLLTIARSILTENGAAASLRDIARKAGVGLGTLYRHFPTREALLEALLRKSFDDLAAREQELVGAGLTADAALALWLGEAIAVAHLYRGLPQAIMSAIDNRESALHASCVAVRASCADMLKCAQASSVVRPDLHANDLFAMIVSLASLRDHPALTAQAERLFELFIEGIRSKA